MAIIEATQQKAEVQAMGQAMNASVNFSGALMEMLATVYVYILMAAIREAVQNACDAARRNGLSFSAGVEVILPTADNPMITVVDRGAGMTQAFMEDPQEGYLSFGSTTKRNDDDSVGGLGVGRWAAYGYIRECYIATCHPSDMVQRTYFQFQGPDAKPQVQLASEVPGKAAGTKVFFPVKETDIDEALRAVAWLKEVMQLTMGDSFSVDTPGRLPTVLPKASGTVLELGDVDATLAGVKVYPMQGEALKYSRSGTVKGSLVVLTNKAAGVGGLPFHVQALSDDSVFAYGMVVEIPMSFRVPFMPSREEVKYTDEVHSLMRSIDVAAKSAVISRTKVLFETASLSSKLALSDLLGESESWHFFARAARAETSMSSELRDALGGRNWTGSLTLPYLAELRDRSLVCKHLGTFSTVKEVHSDGGKMAVSDGKDSFTIKFSRSNKCLVVVNDLKTRGLARFRSWAEGYPKGTRFIYFAHLENTAIAEAAARALSDSYGGELELVRTSSMPEFKRVVVGSKVLTTKVGGGGSLVYYCTSEGKQKTACHGLGDGAAGRRVWVGKNGAVVKGMKPDTMLAHMFDGYSAGLDKVLREAEIARLYLLNQKQEDELVETVSSLQEDGYWDMSEAELLGEPDGALLAATVSAAKSWTNLEDVVQEVFLSSKVQDVVAGRVMQSVTESACLSALAHALAKKPRMELTGTRFDKAIAPHVDLLSGVVHLHRSSSVRREVNELCQALARFGSQMLVATDDTPQRTALCNELLALRTAGTVNYTDLHRGLVQNFPLLGSFKIAGFDEREADAVAQALAALYR